MTPTLPRLVVFDMDGVLVDSEPCHAEAYAELWRRCGIEGPAYPEIAGRSTREAVKEITASLDPTPEQVDDWVVFKQQRARECLERGDPLFPETRDVLAALRKRGVPYALATAATRVRTEMLLPKLGGADAFASVVTADDVRRAKPDPEIFRLAFERAGCPPEDGMVVEDSASGIRAGLATGARVAGVRSAIRVDEPRYSGPFADLAGWLRWLGLEA